MNREDRTLDPSTGRRIDIRSIPRTNLDWSAAFRLRPARIPETNGFEALAEDSAGMLKELVDVTAPSARMRSGAISLAPAMPAGTSPAVVSAFSSSLPEWRFAKTGTAHMLLASSLNAAVDLAAEIYGQFLADTRQDSANISFKIERFRLAGQFADVSDAEIFPDCYDQDKAETSRELVHDLVAADEPGLVFQTAAGLGAVILQPSTVSYGGVERAVCLAWKNDRFERLYDYRDMYWRDL